MCRTSLYKHIRSEFTSGISSSSVVLSGISCIVFPNDSGQSSWLISFRWLTRYHLTNQKLVWHIHSLKGTINLEHFSGKHHIFEVGYPQNKMWYKAFCVRAPDSDTDRITAQYFQSPINPSSRAYQHPWCVCTRVCVVPMKLPSENVSNIWPTVWCPQREGWLDLLWSYMYTYMLMGPMQTFPQSAWWGGSRGPVHTVGPAWALPALSIQMKWDGKPPFIPSNIQATALGTASATPLSRQGTQSLCFSWQTHVCLTWSSHTLASWTARLRQRLFLMKPKIKPRICPGRSLTSTIRTLSLEMCNESRTIFFHYHQYLLNITKIGLLCFTPKQISF